MSDNARLIDDGAVFLLLASEEEHAGPFTPEQIEWAHRALGIGQELEHDGDCTKSAHTCRLCKREEYQCLMHAALAAIEAFTDPDGGTYRIVRFVREEPQPFVIEEDSL